MVFLVHTYIVDMKKNSIDGLFLGDALLFVY